MPDFLVRDFQPAPSAAPFKVMSTVGPDLPRGPELFYVPWALTADGRVVYTPHGAHSGWSAVRDGVRGLKQYSTVESQDRRRMAEAMLGMIALDAPRFSESAVSKVSSGLKFYLLRHYHSDPSGVAAFLKKQIGHYFFTGGGQGFGRISEADVRTMSDVGVWQAILTALTDGRIDQKLAIHDAVGRKILPQYGGDAQRRYDALANKTDPHGNKIREAWFDDPKKRGRANVAGYAPTTTGGTAPNGVALPQTAIARNRGVDMFRRDPARSPDRLGDAYFEDLDARNLLFGASISGTTGTLLQAAVAFGKLSGDDLKQYLFAIIGYLVGGGMHSYHESMEVARRIGIPYDPGKYDNSLPASFLISQTYRDWRLEYYDIVVLGATHWRFNARSGGANASTLTIEDKQRLAQSLRKLSR